MTSNDKLEDSRRTAIKRMIGRLDDYQLEREHGPVSVTMTQHVGTRTFRLIVTEEPRRDG